MLQKSDDDIFLEALAGLKESCQKRYEWLKSQGFRVNYKEGSRCQGFKGKRIKKLKKHALEIVKIVLKI